MKDFVAPSLARHIEARRSSTEVFQRYAEPLSAFAINLFWRLKETLANDGRGFYLSAIEPRSEFEKYKILSTYYRLAAMLGCIRALQQELLYFRVEQKRVDNLEKSLQKFEVALADGREVEIRRLRGLLSLYNADLKKNSDEVHVAVDLERIKRVWMSKREETTGSDLSRRDQRILIDIIERLEQDINTTVPKDVRDATLAQAMRWLFIKQAWLYRDWQASIGDMMLKPAHAGNRSFEIVGFGEFEQMSLGPTDEQYRNLSRIACVFDGLQIDKEDPFDARGLMVRKIYVATAELIVALSGTNYSKYLIPEATLIEANLITHPSSAPQ